MRSQRSIAEWLSTEATATPTELIKLHEFAVDANRAFEGCIDHGVLRRTVERPLCAGPDGAPAIRGPEGYTCHALDDECVRGELTPNACCSQEPRPDGIPCEGGGQCLAGTCVPPGFASAPVSAEPILGVTGSEHWIDLTTRRTARFDYIEGGGVRIYVDDQPVAELQVPPDLSLDQVRVAPPTSGDAVGILAPPGLHTLFVPFSAATRICTVSGDPSDPRVVWSDCTGPGVEVVCPGNVGDVQCTVAGGFAKVTGPDLLIAWPLDPAPAQPTAQPPGDVAGSDGGLQLGIDANVGDIVLPPPIIGDPIPPPSNGDAGFPPGAILDDLWTRLDLCTAIPDLGCAGSSHTQPQCSFGQARSCRLPDGSTSVQLCGLRDWGPCLGSDEVCNGIDDNHDGQIDEGLTAQQSCDDGLNCTDDLCVLGGTCVHRNTAPCKDTASCTTHTCSRTFTTPPPTPFPGIGIRIEPSSPFCHATYDNTVCQDGCDCNGAEVCNPAAAPPHAGIFFDGCAPGATPCNEDMNLCTVEACVPVPEQEAACLNALTLPGTARPPSFPDAVIRVLRRRDLTSVQPWSAFDASRTVECVLPRRPKIGGRRIQTFGVTVCPPDGILCTSDECNRNTGTCPYTPLSPGNACFPPPPAGFSSAEVCARAECNGNLSCLYNARTGEHFEKTCEEIIVEGPRVSASGARRNWQRMSFNHQGQEIFYQYNWWTRRFLGFGLRGHSVVVPSCHSANDCVGGVCTVRAVGTTQQSAHCPPAPGCLENICANPPQTNIGVGNIRSSRDHDLVIGCTPIQNAGACLPDLAAQYPLNECLLPVCNANGSCGAVGVDALCASRGTTTCPFNEGSVGYVCSTATGACVPNCPPQ